MRIISNFAASDVVQDGEFALLSRCDTKKPGTLAYCESFDYLHRALTNPNVTALIATPELLAEVPRGTSKGLIRSAVPHAAFYRKHNELSRAQMAVPLKQGRRGVDSQIDKRAHVHESAEIGLGVIIEAGAIVHANSVIEDHAFIGSGAVVGADGLLYFTEAGRHYFVHHAGGVRIGAHAAILSNAVIAKAIEPGDYTLVGANSMIGIATTVGHEAAVGENCIVAGNCVIARLAKLGDGARLGSSCVIREHVLVGNGAQVHAGSIVVEGVEAKQAVSGNFAIPHRYHAKRFVLGKQGK